MVNCEMVPCRNAAPVYAKGPRRWMCLIHYRRYRDLKEALLAASR